MPLDQKTIIDMVKQARGKSKKRNFNQSIELVLKLQEIDMKSPEAKINEILELPHASEKQNRICVIGTGEMALKARRANADMVIERAELEALAGKKHDLRKMANDYDFFIAEAPLMPLVGKILGPILGPRGKMPIPVAPNVSVDDLINRVRKTVRLRIRDQPVLSCRSCHVYPASDSASRPDHKLGKLSLPNLGDLASARNSRACTWDRDSC